MSYFVKYMGIHYFFAFMYKFLKIFYMKRIITSVTPHFSGVTFYFKGGKIPLQYSPIETPDFSHFLT
jgi:hypothetical protein